jgi:hypothetical protein
MVLVFSEIYLLIYSSCCLFPHEFFTSAAEAYIDTVHKNKVKGERKESEEEREGGGAGGGDLNMAVAREEERV